MSPARLTVTLKIEDSDMPAETITVNINSAHSIKYLISRCRTAIRNDVSNMDKIEQEPISEAPHRLVRLIFGNNNAEQYAKAIENRRIKEKAKLDEAVALKKRYEKARNEIGSIFDLFDIVLTRIKLTEEDQMNAAPDSTQSAA